MIDECLGRYAVPEALRAAGADVILHSEVFESGTTDDVWLVEASRLEPVAILSKDRQIRKRTIEYEAVMAGRLRVFILTAGGLTSRDQAEAFRRALPRILRLCSSRVRS